MISINTMCNILGLLMGLYVTVLMIVAPNSQPFSVRKSSALLVAGESWTAQDLAKLARTDKLAAAVNRLTSAARDSGAPALEVEGMQGAIDAASDVDIRIALLTVADGDDYRKEDPLAVFARTVNAAVTCGTSGTAGGDGLDICVDRCERKPSWLDLRTPRKGACYALCSLAIAPCTEGIFSLETSTKDWGIPRRSWMTVKVEAIASILQNMTVSTALAYLSVGIDAALDVAWTPTTLKVIFVLVLIRQCWVFVRKLQKRAKVANDEMKKTKLKQLFKIRGRLLKKEGMDALHVFGARAIYRDYVKAAKAERQKAGCRLLGVLVSGRRKRAMATRFVRWQGAAATMSAGVEAASSEADATDGEDMIAG